MECATCGIAPCDLPYGVDPDDVFVTDKGVTNCIPCATGHSLVVTFTSDGTDGDRGESHEGIRNLIERSSLGTPGAKALRDRTPDEIAGQIVARSKELDESHGGEADDD
jgi:hypothetical protein